MNFSQKYKGSVFLGHPVFVAKWKNLIKRPDVWGVGFGKPDKRK